jgi:hypothetical protein
VQDLFDCANDLLVVETLAVRVGLGPAKLLDIRTSVHCEKAHLADVYGKESGQNLESSSSPNAYALKVLLGRNTEPLYSRQTSSARGSLGRPLGRCRNRRLGKCRRCQEHFERTPACTKTKEDRHFALADNLPIQPRLARNHFSGQTTGPTHASPITDGV